MSKSGATVCTWREKEKPKGIEVSVFFSPNDLRFLRYLLSSADLGFTRESIASTPPSLPWPRPRSRTGAVLFSGQFSGVFSGASPYAHHRWNPVASPRKPSSSHAVRSAFQSPVPGRRPLPSTIAAFEHRNQSACDRFPARPRKFTLRVPERAPFRGTGPRLCGPTPRRKTGKAGPRPTGPFPPVDWGPHTSHARAPPHGRFHPRRARLRHNHPPLPSHE